MGTHPDGVRRLVVTVCAVWGPVLRYSRVERWYTYDKTGTLHIFRDGNWERITLSRKHIGVYAQPMVDFWPSFDPRLS